MMPFIHIGPVTLASFGLCVFIAMIVAYFVLARDVQRRGIHAPADMLIAVPCIAGLIGAKLYHVFEDPRLLMANPRELISQYGFAWFGGFIAGVAGFVWMARRYRVPLLEMFDAASPAAALGYGIGRIGCLVSGDGDYGKPTSLPWGMSFPHGLVPTTQKVHPTPIYELIVAIFIFWWLWKLGGKQALGHMKEVKLKPSSQMAKGRPEGRPYKDSANDGTQSAEAGATVKSPPFAARLSARKAQRMGHPQTPGGVAGSRTIPRGTVFAHYLIWTGVARFLVEFIRINPRSFFGMTNAQTAALGSIILGVILIWYLRRSDQDTSSRRDQSLQKSGN
jgi:phosphatidylglycerol---prolipoprotein diacylglyceryl transferase